MRFIRLQDVIEKTGLPRASIYKRMKVGLFPKSVAVGGRAVAWIEQEILDWMADRVAERDKD